MAMRIGVMLRCIDERGGIGVYARNIVEELLKIDHENHYVLFFRTQQHIHRYSGFSNVTKRLIPGRSRVIWDQIRIPRAARSERVDLIFNPKFTLPLARGAKAVMVVHGADWFLPEHRGIYHPFDVLYMRVFMPLYFRRADAVISASEFSTKGFVDHLPSCKNKIRTIYYAHKDIFRPISDRLLLQRMREKHGLGDPFILTVIHYDSGRKNFANMLEAYRLARQRGISHKFVVCGRDVGKYALDHPLEPLGLAGHVVFLGWMEQEDLPAVYNSADLYLYPTRLEGFPIPVSEAMACGCAIVTSTGGVFDEVAGDAALHVNPEDPQEIADGICRVLKDDALKHTLQEKGIERSKRYTWAACAAQTLALFQSLMSTIG